jgi:hypothetical protein
MARAYGCSAKISPTVEKLQLLRRGSFFEVSMVLSFKSQERGLKFGKLYLFVGGNERDSRKRASK